MLWMRLEAAVAAEGCVLRSLYPGDGGGDGFVGDGHRLAIGVDQRVWIDGDGNVAGPEQQIAALEFALYGVAGGFLQVGVAWDRYAASMVGELGEARAVNACAGVAAPQIGRVKELFGHGDGVSQVLTNG